MKQKKHSGRSRILLRVPIELRRSILEQICDLRTLFNCIISHRTWHEAFHSSDPSSLIAGVICNGHPLAVALFYAKSIGKYPHWDPKKRMVFLDELRWHGSAPDDPWTRHFPKFSRDNKAEGRKVAIEMAKDHAVIRKLANKFVSAKINENPFALAGSSNRSRRKALPDPVPSVHELRRIQDAFYALYIAQHVFPANYHRTDRTEKVDFFSCLGIWESRAVIAVYKFLRTRLNDFHYIDDGTFSVAAAGVLFRVPLDEIYPWLFEMSRKQHQKKFDRITADGNDYPECKFARNMGKYERFAALGRRSWLERQGLVYEKSRARPICNAAAEFEAQEDESRYEGWAYEYDMTGMRLMNGSWGSEVQMVIPDAGVWDDERLLARGGKCHTDLLAAPSASDSDEFY